jgi:hypothetical protein
MNSLRAFTENANVVVRFLQSINCLFLQIRWLENNLRGASNEKLAVVLILVCLIGYYTFGCSGGAENIAYACSEDGVSTLIVLALVLIIAYFLYKRYQDRADNSPPADAGFDEEREKFIREPVAPFDQISIAHAVPVEDSGPYRV